MSPILPLLNNLQFYAQIVTYTIYLLNVQQTRCHYSRRVGGHYRLTLSGFNVDKKNDSNIIVHIFMSKLIIPRSVLAGNYSCRAYLCQKYNIFYMDWQLKFEIMSSKMSSLFPNSEMTNYNVP